MPAARFVASEMPSTSIPTWRAAIASSTVDMPTRSAPIVAAMRISAGVSKCGPWKPEVHALGQVGVDRAGEVAQARRCRGRSGRRSAARPSGGGFGPVSGDRPVRLMWSLISTGWPIGHSGRSEPGAVGQDHRAAAGGGGDADADGRRRRGRGPRRGGGGRGRRGRGAPSSVDRADRAAVADRPTAAGSRAGRRTATVVPAADGVGGAPPSPSRARRRRRGERRPSPGRAPRRPRRRAAKGSGHGRADPTIPRDAHHRVARRPRRPDRPDPAAPRDRRGSRCATSTR